MTKLRNPNLKFTSSNTGDYLKQAVFSGNCTSLDDLSWFMVTKKVLIK